MDGRQWHHTSVYADLDDEQQLWTDTADQQVDMRHDCTTHTQSGDCSSLLDGDAVLFGPFLDGAHDVLDLRVASVSQHRHHVA